MQIRRAKPEDARAISEINIITWKDAYKDLLPAEFLANRNMSEDKVEKSRARILEQAEKNTIMLIAEDDGKACGFLWGGNVMETENPPCTNEVYAIYVLPTKQKLGIGRKMLEEFKKLRGADDFFLYMIKGNKSGFFYEASGGIAQPQYEKIKEIGGINVSEVMYLFK